MVPPKLLAYLREKKTEGYPDAMMTDVFLRKGWPKEILDEVYRVLAEEKSRPDEPQVPKLPLIKSLPSTPVVTITSVTPSKETPPPTPPPSPSSSSSTPPTKWQTTLSVALILAAGSYGSITSKLAMILVIFQKTLFSHGTLGGSVLTTYPGFIVIFVVTGLAGVYAFYLALRSRAFSPQSWKTVFVGTLLLPFVFYTLINLAWFPLHNQLKAAGADSRLLLPSYDFFWILFALGMLLVTKNMHIHQDTFLTGKHKLWLGIVTGMTVLVTLVVVLYASGSANTASDLGYVQVSQQAGHPVHRLSSLPNDLVYGTQYEIKEKEDGSRVVRLGLGTPLNQMKEDTSEVIVIAQSPAPADYQPLMSFEGAEEQVREVPVGLARGGVAYIGKTGIVMMLEFVTEDDVVIQIMSPRTTEERLIQLAGLLE